MITPVIAVLGQPIWSDGMAFLMFVVPVLPGVLFLLLSLFARSRQGLWRILIMAYVVSLVGYSLLNGWGLRDFVPTQFWQSGNTVFDTVILSGQIIRATLALFSLWFVVLMMQKKPNKKNAAYG